MAGFGFNATNNMATSSGRKATGIQFVKSTEVVGSPHNPSSAANEPAGSAPGQHNANAQVSKAGSSTYGHTFVKCGEKYSSLESNRSGVVSSSQGYRMPGPSNLNKGGVKSGGGGSTTASVKNFRRAEEAKPVCTIDEYLRSWRLEQDADMAKLRKLAYEVVNLKTDRPNAKDKLHSAANRVPIRIEFNIEPVFGARTTDSYLCYVYIEGVTIASGQGPKRKDAKTNAYEAALQKILMPHLRVIPRDPTSKILQVSKEPFTSPPPEPSKEVTKKVQEVPSQHKESNMEAAGLKRRHNEYKQLDEFVVVEPKVPIQDCTAAHTLRRSADFNHMLLEYEYFFKGEAARCILRIENQVLADVNGMSKVSAKNTASMQALLKLKKFCWIIKTKQAVDSNTKVSKEEMLNELNEQSDSISNDNIGNKLLRKMGWSGGGVGKDGSGIAEPVSLKSVLNREGLGLSSAKGITDEFRRKIKDVIETYAASDNQEDLVFSSDFRLEERQIIHDECRRLNLRSKSKGKGQKRYLCVRRKRSVNQLFDHLMSVGGETARYQLVPPGQEGVQSVSSASPDAYRPQQCQLSEACPRPLGSLYDSNCTTNNGAVNNSKQFLPQSRNSQVPNHVTSSVNATTNTGVGVHGRSTPNQTGAVPSFARTNSRNGNNFMDNRQGSYGSCRQNQFPGKFGDNNIQSNGASCQLSSFARGSGNNISGHRTSNTNRMAFTSQRHVDSDYDNRGSAPNNMGFTPQNNHGKLMYPAQSNSPSFRSMGNNMSSGSPHPGTMATGFQFQQNNVNPPVFNNQGRDTFKFQGHQNNAATRMAFNNVGTPMPMGGAHHMSSPQGMGQNQTAANPNWNGHGGHNGDGGQWGMCASGAGEMTNAYPGQCMQQQGMGSRDVHPQHTSGAYYR